MFNWIRRRRLSPLARKRLLLVAARAEEALIETHVANVLDLLKTLGDEVSFDRGLEIYSEMMGLEEARATSVANRVLAGLEQPAEAPTPPRAAGERRQRFRHVFRENSRR
ncbi:MAG: hypothetical protein GEU90_00195 [Gemmatimonas sp.]|nr:hypothetical protein [Gemmatimonas sp.]